MTIINPVAGAAGQGRALHGAIGVLRRSGVSVVTQRTGGPGDAREMAREGAPQADAVLVVGGDGTVGEVANGLAGGDVPMIIWPAGTENLVARSLGFRARADAVLATLTSGRVMPLDLGVVNGQSFLVVVGAGFDAEVVHRLTSCRRGHITHLSYAGPIWRTFWEHRFPRMRVSADGSLMWEGTGMVFIGNMARYALGLPVVRDANPTDALLDVCIMPCRGKIDLLGHSVRTVLGRHVEHPGVRYERVHQVRVESPSKVPVEVDGDVCGHLPIDVTIRPGALRVKVPPVVAEEYNPRA